MENEPNDLMGLSEEELLSRLREAIVASEDPESDSAVEALEEAILALEQKSPTGLLPDKREGFKDLLARLPERHPAKRRLRRALGAIFRYGTAAVLAVALSLGGMITAEAAGRDVFGTLSQFARDMRASSGEDQPALPEDALSGSYDTLSISGLDLKPWDGSVTLQHLREERAAEYTVTVESLTILNGGNGRVPVYISILVDGRMATQVPVEGPCTFTLPGEAGNCVITAVSNMSVDLDLTIERTTEGGAEG